MSEGGQGEGANLTTEDTAEVAAGKQLVAVQVKAANQPLHMLLHTAKSEGARDTVGKERKVRNLPRCRAESAMAKFGKVMKPVASTSKREKIRSTRRTFSPASGPRQDRNVGLLGL